MVLSLSVAIAILLVCSAISSMSEAAFLAVNKVRLRHLMQRGSAPAKLVYRLLTRLDRLIATILVTNNLVNVVISVLGTMLCVALFGLDQGPVIAVAAITVLVLLFGEITPKLFAAAHADRTALLLAWPLDRFIWLMQPLTWFFTWASRLIMRLLGERRMARSPLITEEELKVMIEMGREAGVVAEHELRMLHRIFEFDDTIVRDVMIPREQIAAIEITQPPEAILDMLIEEGHSRLPVYRGSLDRVEGVIYARDLLAMWRHGGLFAVPDLLHPAYYVPQTKRVAELLSDFQRMKIQIAIVQDPQRATLGLVTLEDLIEEIVGEIREEIPPARG